MGRHERGLASTLAACYCERCSLTVSASGDATVRPAVQGLGESGPCRRVRSDGDDQYLVRRRRRSGPFRHPDGRRAASRRRLWRTTCFEAFLRRRTVRPTASGISRRRAIGPPMISPAIAMAWHGPKSASALRPGRGQHDLVGVGATIAARPARNRRLGLSAVLEEQDGDQILLGARASRREARFPRRRLLHRAARLNQPP